MGRPKMLLPWGKSTVLQTVTGTLRAAGIGEILVITGAERQQVEDLVGQAAETVYNPNYESGEMLSSIQAGLDCRSGKAGAAMIALGDQPQMQLSTVQRILQAVQEKEAALVVPSHANHRGHPWLVGSQYWDEILEMQAPASMRDFFRRHEAEIHYVTVDTPSVLADLDTPEDYEQSKP
jgi:molybdenum cofactor cytidylyltransferase